MNTFTLLHLVKMIAGLPAGVVLSLFSYLISLLSCCGRFLADIWQNEEVLSMCLLLLWITKGAGHFYNVIVMIFRNSGGFGFGQLVAFQRNLFNPFQRLFTTKKKLGDLLCVLLHFSSVLVLCAIWERAMTVYREWAKNLNIISLACLVFAAAGYLLFVMVESKFTFNTYISN